MLNEEQFLRIVKTAPLVSIDLIVRNGRNRVLLGKRVNRPAAGFWFVPGGRIWKNERLADALQRIARRELGTVVRDTALIGVFDHIYDDNFAGAPKINTHYVSIGFECRLPSSAVPKADDQHEEMKWWGVRELLSHPAVHDHTKMFFRGQRGR